MNWGSWARSIKDLMFSRIKLYTLTIVKEVLLTSTVSFLGEKIAR